MLNGFRSDGSGEAGDVFERIFGEGKTTNGGGGEEKMDKWDRLGLLKEWELEYVRLERIFRELSKVFGGNPDCELFEAMWGNFEKYTSMLERVLGDKNESLKWFWIDNKMGKGKLRGGVNGVERDIEGLRDLLWLIGEVGPGGCGGGCKCKEGKGE